MEAATSSDDFSDSQIRRSIWHHTTTSVGLVTSVLDGKPNVMACEWSMQVSINPPRFLIVIGKRKATAEYISKTGEFGLTFASDAQAELCHVAGSFTGYEYDKIATNTFSLRNGHKIKAPIVTDGILSVECKVIRTIELDERFIFIGEVLFAEWRNDKSPILYHAGNYFQVGEKVPKPQK